jgi:hypothetical protein
VTAAIPHQDPGEEQKGFGDALVQSRHLRSLNPRHQLNSVAVLIVDDVTRIAFQGFRVLVDLEPPST